MHRERPTENDESLLAGVRLLLVNRVAVLVDAVHRPTEHTNGAHIREPPCPAQHAGPLLLGQLLGRHNRCLVSVSPLAELGDALALLARGRQNIAALHRRESPGLRTELSARGGGGESGERLESHRCRPRHARHYDEIWGLERGEVGGMM